MGTCDFTVVEESFSPRMKGGLTAYANKDADFPPTAIYLPHPGSKGVAYVVLWLHGYYVRDVYDLIRPAESKNDMNLRENVHAADKGVVFVAPWLGHKTSMTSGTLGLGALGTGEGCKAYLQSVLKGLAALQKKRDTSAPSSVEMGDFVIAGHSAGGGMMRTAMTCLGDFDSKLKECWGFDCFYDPQWPTWAEKKPNVEKFLYVARDNGGAGQYAYDMMRLVYGTPKAPVRGSKQIPNCYLAPAVDRVLTANDEVAFQTIDDLDDRHVAISKNLYTNVRKATDPYLEKTFAAYWGQLRPHLTGHFQVVRDLLAPRIQQSKWL